MRIDVPNVGDWSSTTITSASHNAEPASLLDGPRTLVAGIDVMLLTQDSDLPQVLEKGGGIWWE